MVAILGIFYQMSFQGKYLFLTYPQCPRSKDDLLAHILSLNHHAERVVVCRERHSDGSPHLHVAVHYSARVKVRHSFFDFEGYHPNIQRVRSWIKAVRYCKKDGDTATYPEDMAWMELEEEESREMDEVGEQTEEMWLRSCLERRMPYGYAARLWAISRTDHGAVVEGPSEGSISDDLKGERFEGGSTCVVGASGIGKTTWGIQQIPKPALWVTHMDDLRRFDPKFHRGIIFDDMDFRHMPVTAQIHLVDQEQSRSIHARYNVCHIPAYTPKIFTCNVYPFDAQSDAISRRIQLINIF